MSKYAMTETTFDNENYLVDGLKTLGYTPRVCAVAEQLEGYMGDKRSERAHIIIPRKQVGGAANDIGFVKESDGKFRAIISEFDSHRHGAEWMGKLKTAYAEHRTMARAKANGYTFAGREIVQNDKGQQVVRLKFNPR